MTNTEKTAFSMDSARATALLQISQPITATQLARRCGMESEQCMYLLANLAEHGFVRCLNPKSSRNKLHWLTAQGMRQQNSLRVRAGYIPLKHELPTLDWQLYASICYSQRCAVVKVLNRPMQPAEIKRKIRLQLPNVRISANNVRDIIRIFEREGVVQRVVLPKKAHAQYELTKQGKEFQKLLWQAEIEV